MQDKTTTNLTNFKPVGGLGSLFEKAKMHNHLNLLFQKALPSKLNGLTLCLVEGQKVTLLATNASIAFRAEKQQKASAFNCSASRWPVTRYVSFNKN